MANQRESAGKCDDTVSHDHDEKAQTNRAGLVVSLAECLVKKCFHGAVTAMVVEMAVPAVFVARTEYAAAVPDGTMMVDVVAPSISTPSFTH